MKINKFFLALAIFGFLALAASALAVDYQPMVKIPGIPAGADFLQYLKGIYNFLISIVGILAMAALVYGGFRYLTSVGNPAAVEDAKDIINSAIIGLVLALGSWLILNEINPDILVVKKPGQIGAITGKYVYNQSSFAKCFSNVDDPGHGTEGSPCDCKDGTPQYSTKTRTNLTLSLSPTSPPPSAPSGSMTASGKLIDGKEQGISGKTIKINRVNANTPPLDASSTFTTTTATDGGFTLTSPVPCSDTATLQAIFDGDTTYTFAVSNPVALTIGGTPVCIASSYDSANPPVASILSTSFCQNLCSVKDYANDTKYHCMKADLRVGATAHPTSKDITIKAGDKVYFDARTYSADYNYSSLNLKGDSYTLPPSFDNGIDRYEIDFSTPIIGLPVADYGASEGTSCSFLWGALGAINNFWGVAGVTDTTKGDLIPLYPYSSTGKYEVKLNIQSKNGCYETIDKAYVNVNP